MYVGIKENKAAKLVSYNEVQNYSKELAAQILCKMLNCSFYELMDTDITLCKRFISSYHAKNSYDIKVKDKEAFLSEAARR